MWSRSSKRHDDDTPIDEPRKRSRGGKERPDAKSMMKGREQPDLLGPATPPGASHVGTRTIATCYIGVCEEPGALPVPSGAVCGSACEEARRPADLSVARLGALTEKGSSMPTAAEEEQEEAGKVLASANISIEFESLQYDGSCWLEPLSCHRRSPLSSVPYTTHSAPEQQLHTRECPL